MKQIQNISTKHDKTKTNKQVIVKHHRTNGNTKLEIWFKTKQTHLCLILEGLDYPKYWDLSEGKGLKP